MTKKSPSAKKFFDGSDLTKRKLASLVKKGLKDADFGEFYQETSEIEALSKSKGVYTQVSVGNGSSGFGFRVGKGERVGYAYSADFNEASVKEAIEKAQIALSGKDTGAAPETHTVTKGAFNHDFGSIPAKVYKAKSPMLGMDLAAKIAKIDDIEAFAKSLHEDIVNVAVSYRSEATDVHIVTSNGKSLTDTRPATTLAISITVKGPEGNTETGTALLGGRIDCKEVFKKTSYEAAAKKALKQAQTLLVAEPAPSGVMDVVLSSGWPAVLLHEAVGHGLEGDFNRKHISVYSGKIGQQVAGPEVTIIDQGDMPGERGSLHFDDEGIPTRKNILVEKGVLKGYMHDRQSAILTGSAVTGNGRRETYEDLIMPRMTNTYFDNGPHTPEEIIASVKDGLYISDMGGGSVDITSGKFNMRATLAYRIRDGKLCEPVKGATLVGDGLTVIKSITMVGNDLDIEKSAGMCGKNGQNVIVSCGQPTVRVANMTIGGSK